MKTRILDQRHSFLIFTLLVMGALSCKSETKSTPNLEAKIATSTTADQDGTEVDKEVLAPIEVDKDILAKDRKTPTPVPHTEKTAPNNPKPINSTSTPPKKTKVTESASEDNPSLPTSSNPTEPVTQKPIDKEGSSTETTSTPPPSKPNKSEPNPPTVPTNEETDKPEKPPKIATLVGYPNHKMLNSILSKYVSSTGMVDYAALKKNEALLDEYLETLETSKITSTWSREDKLAFWINAYNAYTIKLILDNYPVAKITDLHGGKPWDQKWIKLDGQTLSLNNIENDIIRPTFNEPRIHFAVNCAAQSCPPLLNAAYDPAKLAAQLESQTKKFINNPKYNTLSKNDITVSKIFDWYSKDFGDVGAYVAKYADTVVKPSASISYNEYDWSLNGK